MPPPPHTQSPPLICPPWELASGPPHMPAGAPTAFGTGPDSCRDGSRGPVPPDLDSSLPQMPRSRWTGWHWAPGTLPPASMASLHPSQQGGSGGSPSSNPEGSSRGHLASARASSLCFLPGSGLRACGVSSSPLPGGWGRGRGRGGQGAGLPGRGQRQTEEGSCSALLPNEKERKQAAGLYLSVCSGNSSVPTAQRRLRGTSPHPCTPPLA